MTYFPYPPAGEDIDDFTDIMSVVVWSKHLRIYLESLQQSSVIFGNRRKKIHKSGTFVWKSSVNVISLKVVKRLVFIMFHTSLLHCAHSRGNELNTRKRFHIYARPCILYVFSCQIEAVVCISLNSLNILETSNFP